MQLNADLRAVRRGRGELGADIHLPTADGDMAFAVHDRIQFTGTDKKRGLYNGAVGTIEAIDGTSVIVRLDRRKENLLTFDAETFKTFRYGYAGTIYKGQGRTIDQTYLYHSDHWRSAASYVALTRHREKAELFVATNTACDIDQLARQMARVDDRRAASQFHLQRAESPRTSKRPDPARARSVEGNDANTGSKDLARLARQAETHRNAIGRGGGRTR